MATKGYSATETKKLKSLIKNILKALNFYLTLFYKIYLRTIY